MGPRRKPSKRRGTGMPRRGRAAVRPSGAISEAVRDAVVDRVRRTVARTMVRAMESGPAVAALHTVVADAYGVFDGHMAGAEFSPPMACKRGCVHCCYNQISVSEPEALFLGLHALERFGPERLVEVDAMAGEVLGRIRGLTRLQTGGIRHLVPCPLMEGGACSVHPARPLACRGWNSVDADQCRRSLAENDPLAPIENHPFPRRLADAIQMGLLEGARAQGLEAGYLVITRAWRLMRVHGLARCAGEWLAGRPFFGLWDDRRGEEEP